MAKFKIETTSGFRRDINKLLRSHHQITSIYEEIILVLEEDPYNFSKRHDIKKLGGIKFGEGQFRMRKGDWRIRYDIEKDVVILYSFKNRKEGYMN